jgi:C-terminal processing protease CtpA/Prc
MSIRRVVIWGLILLWIVGSAAVVALVAGSIGRSVTIRQFSGTGVAKLSPFTRVEIVDDQARVEFDGKSYRLMSIEGLPVDGILAFCRVQYGSAGEKRFAEDLVPVLNAMGLNPGREIRLEMADLQSGQIITVDHAPMTEKNRNAVFAARNPAAPPLKVQLMPVQMRAAVNDFQKALEERWAYLKPSDFDHRKMIEGIRAQIGAGLKSDQLPVELQKVIAQGIDGHAGVIEVERYFPQGFLPVLLEPSGNQIVAFLPDRSGFVRNTSPYVYEIDGKPIEAWIKAAAIFSPKGSAQYVRRDALRMLRFVQFMRGQMGVKQSSTVVLALGGADPRDSITCTLPLLDRMPTYGTWPAADRSVKMPTGLAYVRIAEMSDDKAPLQITTAMRRYATYKGIVIDVRGNGGGSRAALRSLASILMKPTDKPRVVNAAAYRIHPEHNAKMMATRSLYPENWDGWKSEEREAIAEFKKSFKPAIALPTEQYSAWHYMVLKHEPRDAVFDKPIVVLMDGKCFSATDVFLSALKGMANVTLVGTPSGGGSANSETVTLAGTPLKVRLGTMVSFQADGKLFDTNGVEPDELVEAGPEFFVGGLDAQLKRGIEVLQELGKSP